MGDPWWASELRRMEPALTAFVRRRAPVEAAEEADLAEVVALELTERFARAGIAGYPPSWFGGEPPRAEEAAQFRSLAWQIVRRRLHDRLRSHYLRRQSPRPPGDGA